MTQATEHWTGKLAREEEEKRIRKDEREKVLDDGIALIQKRIDVIFDTYRGETNERLTELPYNMADGMGEAILILKELRQGGEHD